MPFKCLHPDACRGEGLSVRASVGKVRSAHLIAFLNGTLKPPASSMSDNAFAVRANEKTPVKPGSAKRKEARRVGGLAADVARSSFLCRTGLRPARQVPQHPTSRRSACRGLFACPRFALSTGKFIGGLSRMARYAARNIKRHSRLTPLPFPL